VAGVHGHTAPPSPPPPHTLSPPHPPPGLPPCSGRPLPRSRGKHEGSQRGVRGSSEGDPRTLDGSRRARPLFSQPDNTSGATHLLADSPSIQVEVRQHEKGGGANGLCWAWLDRRLLTLTLAL
jgi:hypothetical protein